MVPLALMYLPRTCEKKGSVCCNLHSDVLHVYRLILLSSSRFSPVFSMLGTDKQNQPQTIELSQFVPLLS